MFVVGKPFKPSLIFESEIKRLCTFQMVYQDMFQNHWQIVNKVKCALVTNALAYYVLFRTFDEIYGLYYKHILMSLE